MRCRQKRASWSCAWTIGPNRGVRHRVPDRLIRRLLNVLGEWIDQGDAVGRRDLEQAELRLVGALGDELGIEAHDPVGSNALGELDGVFVAVEQRSGGSGGVRRLAARPWRCSTA